MAYESELGKPLEVAVCFRCGYVMPLCECEKPGDALEEELRAA